jgi:putative transposase
MGGVGACADIAAMESFFSLLQKNVLNRQDTLGRMTPIEFETLTKAAHAA